MIEGYRNDLATVMPSHVKPDVFVRLAVSVLRRDDKLARAAQNNPLALMGALMEAARLGLEPGTEQYYLTPRWNGKSKCEEIAGIVGYQGEIELIYRAGAVSSVIVEVVRENDLFLWAPGRYDSQQPPRWHGPMERPYHQVDWFGERGDLKGVYSYAVMKDGATSKVVVLSRAAVMAAKALSTGSDSAYSPWKNHEEAMWMKTGAHRLKKWVPTSAEYIREQLRAVADVAAEQRGVLPGMPPTASAPRRTPVPQDVHADDGVVDAEFADEPADEFTMLWGQILAAGARRGWSAEQTEREFAEGNNGVQAGASEIGPLQGFLAFLGGAA
jgi:recombination protein RecT